MEGPKNSKIRMMTEIIMFEAVKNISQRKENKLTVGQYNSIYNAVVKILDGNV